MGLERGRMRSLIAPTAKVQRLVHPAGGLPYVETLQSDVDAGEPPKWSRRISDGCVFDRSIAERIASELHGYAVTTVDPALCAERHSRHRQKAAELERSVEELLTPEKAARHQEALRRMHLD
jgi:hypothetical protein